MLARLECKDISYISDDTLRETGYYKYFNYMYVVFSPGP
jgi:hypothetical protein